MANPVCHAKRSNGQPCKLPSMDGQTVCRKHGGSSPQAKAAAHKRLIEADAVKVMRRFGEPVNVNATEALLDTVQWTAGYVAWLREKVASVGSDDELVWGITRRKTAVDHAGLDDDAKPRTFAGTDEGDTYEAKPNVWLQLLETWHDKLVRVCAEAIKAGVEERRVRLAESQGALIAEVIRGILDDLDLTTEQAARVSEIVPRRLRLVS